MAGTARPVSTRRTLQILGPGLITGASDDDPSGIATYSQVGAQFGFGLCWVMLFSFPLMTAIQETCARIGRATGEGIAGNIRRHYPLWLLRVIVTLLLIANIINLGADLGAMGSVVTMIAGGPALFYAVLFGALCAGLQIFTNYRRYVGILKWIAVSLLAYVATALVIDIPWREVLLRTLIPSLQFDTKYIVAIVAVLGTTISPYLFFWQSSQEAEDVRADPKAKPLKRAPRQAPAEFRRIRIDTYLGMFVSNAIGWFIIVSVAATLNAHGVKDIQTASQAAEALRPIAGPFAFFLFALGIIGTGMLAVPVLAGSAAYALAEALRWSGGLARRPKAAKAFYATIALATGFGMIFNLLPIDPIKALFWTAVLNGVVAVPIMVMTMLMAGQKRVMGNFVLPRSLAVMGWIATAVMCAVAVALIVTW
ncbi:MAG TPA: divalent metal cation transporter [Stellaceae bacterium]|jgi:NRAMP (natural resistance-associated macrophage protein)-like metal ion transporter